jgi:DNA-binding NtrC family response regulator
MANILIVDDEEDICDFLSDILQKMGLDVKYVFSGEEALKLIAGEKFDIAFVDLKLSTSITGLNVIKAIRDKCPQTIVAAMSGYIDVGLAQETRHLGVSDYLEKPRDIQPDAFAKKVQLMLQKFGNQK